MMERRYIKVEELRIAGTDTERTIEGYAALFDSLSVNLGGFREKIRPGAFTKTIQEADIRALFNHDPNMVLGRNKSGTLALEEDTRGLRVTIKPPDTTWAADLITSMERGDIDQMSFGFDAIRDEWTTDGEGNNLRELLELRLFDVSPVTFPAYPQTSVQVRSAFYRNLEKRGRNLAAWLNEKIDKVADDEEVMRSEIIARIAQAANRDEDTIRNILSADIDCPPVEVLEGFGAVLDAPIAELIGIAESDGCSYENERSAPTEDSHPDESNRQDNALVRLSYRYKKLQLIESEV